MVMSHDGDDNLIYFPCHISNFEPKRLYGPQINLRKLTKFFFLYDIILIPACVITPEPGKTSNISNDKFE